MKVGGSYDASLVVVVEARTHLDPIWKVLATLSLAPFSLASLERKSDVDAMGKKKKKSLDPPSPETRDRRVIPIIRVASGSGDTDVSIDVSSNNQRMSTSCQPCFVPSDMGDMDDTSSSLASTQSGSIASSNASHGIALTPLEVSRRRSRSRTGRKSYWRRRMEQFDQDNEADAMMNSNNNNTTSGSSASNLSALQQERAPRPSIIFQDGCIASLPLIIQVGFRRKMFSVFALQLLFISSLMALLTYENVLSSLMQSVFETPGWYLFATLAVMVLFLVLLYLGHAVFPLNWMILLLFSVALSVFLSSVQVYLNTNAGLFCCGFTFSAVAIMIPLSGLERCSSTPSEEGGGGDRSERALMSTTRAGLIAFGIVMVCSIVLFAIFEQKFVSSGSAFGLSLLLEFALILWFSYDASTMYSIMSPDEYMSGVIFFYTDLLVVIVITIVFGALALLFSSAGMGAGGFGGSCDCFGCLRVGRVFGNGDEMSANGTPITPIQDMSAGRRDSLAAVVPEEMLR